MGSKQNEAWVGKVLSFKPQVSKVKTGLITSGFTIISPKINITTQFENLTVELYAFYAFNTHVKFCVNQILFTI